MSAGKRRDRSNGRDLRADTAERLEAIVEAAERAAANVIDDAETQARQYLAQARAQADRAGEERLAGISELIETLLGQATSLQREVERLQVTLEVARDRLEPEGRAPEGAAPVEELRAEAAPRLRAVAGGETPQGDPEAGAAPEPERTDPAGARLLATQLAVSGSSRKEIEARLRNRFEIEDTAAILDAILGPEE
jgi:cell division septum initiation protein DivIVA